MPHRERMGWGIILLVIGLGFLIAAAWLVPGWTTAASAAATAAILIVSGITLLAP